MQKTKTDLFRLGAVLTLLYASFRAISCVVNLICYKSENLLDELSFAQTLLYYIVPDVVAAIAIGVPLALGLFSRKRPLILGGLAASAGIALLLNMISIGITFSFDAFTFYRLFSTLSNAAWGVAVLLLVFHLLKRADPTEAAPADAPVIPARKPDLLPIAAVLTAAYAVLRIIAGILYFAYLRTQSDSISNLTTILFGTVFPYFIRPIAAGVLLALGLFLKKRPLVLGGLAVPAVFSFLKSISSFINMLTYLLFIGSEYFKATPHKLRRTPCLNLFPSCCTKIS